MASFVEELWNSIFTPGPTPTLLVATNAVFAGLQLVFLALLLTTYSIHFVVLSVICAGLWWSINWFASEIRAASKAKEEEEAKRQRKKEKSPEPDRGESDTETEGPARRPAKRTVAGSRESAGLLKPQPEEAIRNRRSLVDSSGYVSTDSEWEKVSEGDDKDR